MEILFAIECEQLSVPVYIKFDWPLSILPRNGDTISLEEMAPDQIKEHGIDGYYWVVTNINWCINDKGEIIPEINLECK